jgi:hypothetical protein
MPHGTALTVSTRVQTTGDATELAYQADFRRLIWGRESLLIEITLRRILYRASLLFSEFQIQRIVEEQSKSTAVGVRLAIRFIMGRGTDQ